MRTKLPLLLIFGLFFSFVGNTQNCGDMFYDSGGINNMYSNNENYAITISPDNTGDAVTVNFSSFDVELGWDGLLIYDGPNTSYPLIDSGSNYDSQNCPNGAWTGTNGSLTNYVPTTITSSDSSGALTFVFTSDAEANKEGWEASISCGPPPTCVTPSSFLVDSVTELSATLYWTEINDPQATEWELEYGLTGFIQGTGTLETHSTNVPTITGLLAGTAYDVYVRSNCVADDSSYWSSVLNFTTVALPPACGGMFYDSGGITEGYQNNEAITTTICPDNTGEVVSVSFNSFDIEYGFDVLAIYDGSDLTNLIGAYSGTDSPGAITASLSNGGCLTFVFTSDQELTKPGWEASLNCGPPPTCITPNSFLIDGVTETTATIYWSEINDPQATDWEIEYGLTGFAQGTGTLETITTNTPTITGLLTGTAYDVYVRSKCSADDFSYWYGALTFTTNTLPLVCGDMFYDSGGASQNYGLNEAITTTICPDNTGEVVTVTFNSFETALNYDYLRIFDGSDASSNLLGFFTGTDSPGTITASLANGGCLTFLFTSQSFITEPGWEASISCDPPPTCVTPSSFIVDGTTDTTATIYWSEINEPQATEWEIEYGLTGFTQGTGILQTLSTNIPIITGLLEGTAYDVYVRANCATDDSSYWSDALTFITDSLPPTCGGMFYDSGGTSGNYNSNETITTTICPENTGDVVSVTFTSFDTEGGYDLLKVYDGDSTTNLIGTFSGSISPGLITANLSNGGCLTFVFTSDFALNKEGWEAYVNCGEPTSCLSPSNFLVDDTTYSTAVLYWSESNNPLAIEWQVEYGLAGFTQGTGTLVTVSTNIPTITGLLTGTTYDAYVRSNCSADDSSNWSVPISFTTEGILDVADYHIDSFKVYPNPSKNTVFIKMNELLHDINISLFTLQGQKLFDKNNVTNTTQIDISNLENGVYFLTVYSNSQSFTKRIIKE